MRKISISTIIITLVLWAILPLIFFPQMMWSFHSPKMLSLKLLTAVLYIIHLIRWMRLRIFHFKLNLIDILITLQPLVLFGMYLFYDHYENVPSNIGVLIYILLFYWNLHLLFTLSDNSNNFSSFTQYCLWILVAVCFIESIIGFFQYAGIISFTEAIVYESVVIGTMSNANELAAYLASVIPLLLGLLYLKKRKNSKIFVVPVLFFTSSILYLTKSRGAWIGLLGGLIIYFMPNILKYWRRINKRIVKVSLIVVVLCTGFLMSYKLYLMNKESGSGRIFLWKVTSKMITEFPLSGLGLGNYGVKYLDYQALFFSQDGNEIFYDYAANIKQAHNEYLHIFAERGLIGVIIFIIIIILFYRYGLKAYNKSKHENKIIIKMFSSSITVILVHGFFDCPLNSLPVMLVFYFGLALISNISKETNESPLIETEYTLKKWDFNIPIKAGILIFSLLFVYIGWQSFKEAGAYINWREGMNSANSGNWPQAITFYKEAVSDLPDEGELHFHLAGAYVINDKPLDALPEFEKALKSFNDKNIYMSRSVAYSMLENYNLAENDLNTVIGMYPHLLIPRFELAQMYLETENINKAKKYLKSILEVKPKIFNQNTRMIKKAAADLLMQIDSHTIDQKEH
jgi:O-antigen polymerase